METADIDVSDQDLTLRKSGFRNFDHAAADVILAVAFNSSGNRIAFCSADHKIQVCAVNTDGMWTAMDQWRGHDTEILDASFPGVSINNTAETLPSR